MNEQLKQDTLPLKKILEYGYQRGNEAQNLTAQELIEEMKDECLKLIGPVGSAAE